MTKLDELEDHAGNLRALLDCKRREIRTGDLGPIAVRILTSQADALTARVDALMWQCQLLRDEASMVQPVGRVPGVSPVLEVIPEP